MKLIQNAQNQQLLLAQQSTKSKFGGLIRRFVLHWSAVDADAEGTEGATHAGGMSSLNFLSPS